MNRYSFGILAASALLATILLHSSARGQGLDLLSPVKGAPQRGTITEMGKDRVILEVNSVPRPFAVHDIGRITYANEPSELTSARTAVIQKNYNLATQELAKLKALPDRDLIKHDIDFFKALCQARFALQDNGDREAAIAALVAFVRSAPQSYHFYEAAEVLGELAMSTGKYADAAKYYGPLVRSTSADFQLRGNSLLGRALTADKQYDQALAKFDEVLASDLPTPEVARQKTLAAIGKAVCQAETGKADAAVASLQDIIDKNESQDTTLLARTYNALGRCNLKANKPKDAVLAFLHTDLMYSADPDAHAEALYYLSTHWTDANKSAVAKNTLRERYPGSVWAKL